MASRKRAHCHQSVSIRICRRLRRSSPAAPANVSHRLSGGSQYKGIPTPFQSGVHSEEGNWQNRECCVYYLNSRGVHAHCSCAISTHAACQLCSGDRPLGSRHECLFQSEIRWRLKQRISHHKWQPLARRRPAFAFRYYTLIMRTANHRRFRLFESGWIGFPSNQLRLGLDTAALSTISPASLFGARSLFRTGSAAVPS